MKMIREENGRTREKREWELEMVMMIDRKEEGKKNRIERQKEGKIERQAQKQ